MQMAEISVIIPCYNVENYIDRCMKSIVNQTIGIENLEIILVDDASTDSTYEHLLKWEAVYPESIIVIKLAENGRQGAARNIGMQYATGEYIGFVDSDDWIEPDMYEALLQKMKSGNYDLVQCRLVKNCREEYLQPEQKRADDDFTVEIHNDRDRSDLIASGCISGYPVTKLYKRDMLLANHIFFLEKMSYEDMFFLSILNLYVNKIGFVAQNLYHYFYNPESTSRAKNSQQHYDLFRVGQLQWEEYEKRGILKRYETAFQYEFIQRCYIAGMVRLLQNMEALPYERFIKIQGLVQEKAPDYRNNPYLKPSEVDNILLQLLDTEMTREAWHEIEKMLHKIV